MAVERDTIVKVLALERKLGCRDSAVVGGLDRLLNNWLEENPQTGDRPRVDVTKIVGGGGGDREERKR